MVAIPGTANPDHLRANVGAAQVAEHLTDAEATRLTGLVDESGAVLDRPNQATLDAHRSAADRHRWALRRSRRPGRPPLPLRAAGHGRGTRC